MDPIKLRPWGSLVLTIIEALRFDQINLDTLLVELLKQAICQARFDLAVVLWMTYEPIYIVYANQVRESVVTSIEETPTAFEYKMFFFNKLAVFMSAQELARILKAIHM